MYYVWVFGAGVVADHCSLEEALEWAYRWEWDGWEADVYPHEEE